MKDYKVKFNGAYSPSGKNTGIFYPAGKVRVDQWKKNKNFDMEIEMPKVKTEPKKAPKAKKEKE